LKSILFQIVDRGHLKSTSICFFLPPSIYSTWVRRVPLASEQTLGAHEEPLGVPREARFVAGFARAYTVDLEELKKAAAVRLGS